MGSSPSARLHRREYSTPVPGDRSLPPVPADPIDYRFSIHHPDRLRANVVEAVRVCLAPIQPVDRVLDLGRKKPPAAFPIRLLVPGALVTPGEHAVEPSPFGPVEVLFYVTALAEGELPDARVEVFHGGQLESLPLKLRSDRGRPLWVGIGLAVVLALLLFLPAGWPDAANGDVERTLLNWLPNLPAVSVPLAKLGQGFYAFLATTGKAAALSFVALAGMLLGLAVWAFMRRPQIETVMGDTFQLHALSHPVAAPAFLTPVSTGDLA